MVDLDLGWAYSLAFMREWNGMDVTMFSFIPGLRIELCFSFEMVYQRYKCTIVSSIAVKFVDFDFSP